MKQIKDLPKDWALYLGDDSMPNWKEALICYNELTNRSVSGLCNYYINEDGVDRINNYKKTLTPEEFVSYFEIEPTIEDELAAMRYKVGDVIINDLGDERRVLGVCGLVYLVSQREEPYTATYLTYTQQDLDYYKYKKKQL